MSDSDSNGLNTIATVEGELDTGWSSYGVPKQDGETVAGSSDDEKGKVETKTLPDEVDPENINDRQAKAIQAAVLNRNKTTKEIEDLLDESDGYLRYTLKAKCPNWYETQFKDENSERGPGIEKNCSPEDVRQAIHTNAPVSKAELAERFNVSKSTIDTRLDEIDDYRAVTGVKGYHNLEKVFFPPKEETDSNSSQDETTGTKPMDEPKSQEAVLESLRNDDCIESAKPVGSGIRAIVVDGTRYLNMGGNTRDTNWYIDSVNFEDKAVYIFPEDA